MKTKKIFMIAIFMGLLIIQTSMFMCEGGLSFLLALGLAIAMSCAAFVIALLVFAIEWIIKKIIG